jgi:hypothetical protein
MKLRKLKKAVNAGDYIFQNANGKLFVGTGYIPKLIEVTKEGEDFKVEKHEPWPQDQDHKICLILKELEELVKRGEIAEYFEGQDEVENADNIVIVYYEKDGAILPAKTDKVGWPNITLNGELMYDGEYFLTPAKAAEDALKFYKSTEKNCRELAQKKREEAVEYDKEANKARQYKAEIEYSLNILQPK